MSSAIDTSWIEERAKALGFDLCGVVRAEKFPELARTEQWLAQGYAGEMKYLEDSRRCDPRSVLPGVKSAIVCALNYNTAQPRSTEVAEARGTEESRGWISRYAWGRDYHEALWKKLNALVEAMKARYPQPFEARAYADTGPLQERVLAKYAGLGWLGKNTLVLNSNLGSFFFLGVILTTVDLRPTLGTNELPPPDLCGSCRQCLDACPTGALIAPYVMDARRCISYLTIELKSSIPEELRAPMGTHVFGCDICQDVCPWNRKAPVTRVDEFQPRVFSQCKKEQTETVRLPAARPCKTPEREDRSEESLLLPRLEWLASMTVEEFREVFRGSAVKRAKWRGLVRNACIALGNSPIRREAASHARVTLLLKQLAESPEPVIAESAQWALSRIQGNPAPRPGLAV